MLLGWSQADLGKAAGLGDVTVPRIEARDGELGGRPETAEKIVAALESAGVEFTDGDEPGVKLKKERRPQMRSAFIAIAAMGLPGLATSI